MAPMPSQWLQRVPSPQRKGVHESAMCPATSHALLTGFPPDDKGPYALAPDTVELIPTLGAFSPRGGPVQGELHPCWPTLPGRASVRLWWYLAHKKAPPPGTSQQAGTFGPAMVLRGGAVSHERGTPVRRRD